MRLAARLCWTPLHVAWSLGALVVLVLTRRGATLVFTHYRDIDEDGLDRQMGPLVDALAERNERFVEWTLVPLGSLVANLRRKQRLFVSHAAPLTIAWLFGFGAGSPELRMRHKVRVARWVLRLLRPRVALLIDESGSGQPIVRAARELGIRTVGIQHGDFAVTPQYRRADVAPADVLCVWSGWFLERLLAVSAVYSRDNTAVTGRLRYPAPDAAAAPGDRVLVLGERGESFREALEPFLTAARAGGWQVELRPHPAEAAGGLPSLTAALLGCRVVAGRSSSALLEALYWRRPVVVCGEDPAGFGQDGLATHCTAPEDFPGVCARLAVDSALSVASARRVVWGDGPDSAVETILAVAERRETQYDSVGTHTSCHSCRRR